MPLGRRSKVDSEKRLQEIEYKISYLNQRINDLYAAFESFRRQYRDDISRLSRRGCGESTDNTKILEEDRTRLESMLLTLHERFLEGSIEEPEYDKLLKKIERTLKNINDKSN